MRFISLCLILLTACAPALSEPRADDGCYADRFAGAGYVICICNPATADIRLFHSDGAGKAFGDFHAVKAALKKTNERLAFAMNGGMYHSDRSPVGLYIENGKTISPINTNSGRGNFHMLPNGVFWLSTSKYGGRKSAHVATAKAFKDGAHSVTSATQSGPMLVIDGKLHPKFNKGSTSRRVRNGVGYLPDGRIAFAVSDAPVNFYEFASLFKDRLGSDNALYLDGVISRLYAPQIGRNDAGAPMGPIIGVVEKTVAETAK